MKFWNPRLSSNPRVCLSISLTALCLVAQSSTAASVSSGQSQTPFSASTSLRKPASPYRPTGLTGSARSFYQMNLGIDPVEVKQVSSGLMIRFSYRVVDEEKAKLLTDKKLEPYLLDDHAHVRLVVPTLEKVGQLRQTGTLETGKTYWMVFSNKGEYVKVGDRVSIVIGTARLDGLVVE